MSRSTNVYLPPALKARAVEADLHFAGLLRYGVLASLAVGQDEVMRALHELIKRGSTSPAIAGDEDDVDEEVTATG